MIYGIADRSLSSHAVNYLENLVQFPNEFIERLILLGDNENENYLLLNIVATNLAFKGYKVSVYDESEILSEQEISQDSDFIIINDIFSKDYYNEDESREIEYVLDCIQHKMVLLVFNSDITRLSLLRENGILSNDSIWSRNVLGCKQLFMNINEKRIFKDLLEQDKRGDYRIIKSLEHLESSYEKYNEVEGLTKLDLIYQIRSGNDSKTNSLIINNEHKIQLLETKLAKELDPPVRLESFGRGGGFVGRELSNSDAERYLKQLLQGYYDYIRTGKHQYIDYCERPNEKIMETVFKIKNHKYSHNQ